MEARLTREEAVSLLTLTPATLRTFSRETAGVDSSLSDLNALRESHIKPPGTFAVSVISPSEVDRPAGGEKFESSKWKSKWHAWQNEIVEKENQNTNMPKQAVIDTNFDHTSLCVSESIIKGVQKVIECTMGLAIDIQFTTEEQEHIKAS